MNERKLIKELHALLDIIYEMSGERDWDEMADAAQLSKSTVYRLFTKTTRFPRFMTVQKLAKSVGLEIKFTEKGILCANVPSLSRV